MDTKFPNKINTDATEQEIPKVKKTINSRIIALILFISFALFASALSFVFEEPITFETGKLSYIHDNEDIRNETIRYAKNLQRFYIYFANFDINKAESKLEEINTYIESKPKTSIGRLRLQNYDYNIFYYTPEQNAAEYYNETNEDTVTENSDYIDEDVSTQHPESLYNINLSNMTVAEIMNTQTSLSEAISNYNSVKNYLETNDQFHFYLYNSLYGTVVATNSTDFLNEKLYDLVTTEDSMFQNILFNGEYITNSFKNNMLLCSISIPKDTTSYFIRNEIEATNRKVSINSAVSSYKLPALISLLALALILAAVYYKKSVVAHYNHKLYKLYSKIPLIIKIPLAFIALTFVTNQAGQYSITHWFTYGEYSAYIFYIIVLTLSLYYLFMAVQHIYHILRTPKILLTEPDFKLLISIFNDLKIIFQSNNYLLTTMYLIILIPIIVCVFVIIFFITATFINMEFGYLLLCTLVIVPLFISYSFLKLMSSYAQLNYYINRLSQGDMSPIPENRQLFSAPINNLNHISEGLQFNLDNMIKSERLKTELITNVSHDLKTPLTSIISYVALLKDLHLDNPQSTEYLNILDNKSKRLKILIEDLFEASKLSSGQLELERQNSDIVSLLNQTLGELDQKITESQIEFKVNIPEPPLLVNIDGQRMWRVFDNLLNNILKYSPPKSRAYISITDKTDSVVITFKNMSNYPLDFDASELFERFKRGDVSRTTEGSGLGLSIASNIVELHGGTMDIVIDGDLFKTIITLYK